MFQVRFRHAALTVVQVRVNFSGVVSSSFAALPEVHQPDKEKVAVVFCKPHSILASVSQEVDFEQMGP